MVLFDNAFSPYAFKVRATLYEKAIPHTKHEMRKAADRAALLAVNPRGEVPALQHGDDVVYDSSVICDYLDAVYPETPLLPPTPGGQARCRLLERLADGPLDGAVIVLAIVRLFNPGLEKSHPEVAERATDEIRRFHGALEAELGSQAFLCGDFSRADIAVSPHVAGAVVLGVAPEGRLAAWSERVSARPSIARASAEFMEAFQASNEEEDPFFSRDHLHVRDHRLEWCFRLGLGPWLVQELEAGRLAFSPPV